MEGEIQSNVPPVQPLPQAPTSAPSHTNWSKILLFILLGIIVIAGSIFAGIQIGKNQITNQQPITVQPTSLSTQTVANPTALPTAPNSTSNPTTNWQTYTKLGYEIKYPQSSVVTEFSLDPSIPDLLSSTSTEIKVDGRQAPIPLFVSVWKNLGVNITNASSRDKWCSLLQKELTGQLECNHGGNLPLIQVNGYNAYQATGGRDSTLVKTIYIPHNNYVYKLTASIEDGNGNRFPISDQILSTFKFTN